MVESITNERFKQYVEKTLDQDKEIKQLKEKIKDYDKSLDQAVKAGSSLAKEYVELNQKLEKIKELLKTKMNSTPTSFKESSVKVFAHEIYETLTGKSLSEEIKEILNSQEKE